MPRPTLDAKTVLHGITTLYLRRRRPATAAELAEFLRVSEGTVRRVIDKHHGAVPGSTYTQVARPVYSRDYPGFQLRERLVGAWEPTLDHLADELASALPFDIERED